MKPTFEGVAQLVDADVPLPWDDIVQVILSATSDPVVSTPAGSHSDTTCPVCLSPPVAPRMTRCGHVYCYSCILHYLLVTDTGEKQRPGLAHKHGKRCPICWDDVYAKDLKAVHWVDAQEQAAAYAHQYLADRGSEVLDEEGILTLRLIERPHGTTLALPRSDTWPVQACEYGVYCFQPDALTFARFVLATPEFIVESLDRDLGEVEREGQVLQRYDPDRLSMEYLLVAKHALEEQIAQARVQLEMRSLHRIEAARTALGFQDGSSPAPPPSFQTDSYWFYQAASGQSIFMHPLDVKVLLAQFGAYSRFPNTLQVAIQWAEEGTMDDHLRRRCKYIAHLPMTSDVTFIEVDWARTAALLSERQGTIAWRAFEGMLKQREAGHRQKQAREDRAWAKAEKDSAEQARTTQAHGRPGTGRDAVYTQDLSMSFRESAMVGVEMYFPRHPGAAEEETASHAPAPGPGRPSTSNASTQKTVWGTPAAAGDVLVPGRDAWVMDDAWDALEEASSTERPAAAQPRTQKGKTKLILTGGGRGRI